MNRIFSLIVIKTLKKNSSTTRNSEGNNISYTDILFF